MNPFASKMRKAIQIRCPFCKAEVPPPRRVEAVFTPGGCLAERCSCGAAYAVDETGRLGGQTLLDAQAHLCQGDLDKATTLESGREVEVKHQPCNSQIIHLGSGRLTRTAAAARIWFVRLKLEARQ